MHDVIDLQKIQAYVNTIMERKPELVVDHGNLPATADALRDLIAASGKFYDRDGPVRVINTVDGKTPCRHWKWPKPHRRPCPTVCFLRTRRAR